MEVKDEGHPTQPSGHAIGIPDPGFPMLQYHEDGEQDRDEASFDRVGRKLTRHLQHCHHKGIQFSVPERKGVVGRDGIRELEANKCDEHKPLADREMLPSGGERDGPVHDLHGSEKSPVYLGPNGPGERAFSADRALDVSRGITVRIGHPCALLTSAVKRGLFHLPRTYWATTAPMSSVSFHSAV